MRPKSLILLALALGCGLVASIGISQVLDGSNKTAAVETVPIYVALQNINLGDPVTDVMVSLEEWPKDKVPIGAITSWEEIEDRRPRSPIFAGEPLLDSKLLAKGQVNDPTQGIPANMRLKTVSVDAQKSAAGLLGPGDRVDLQLSAPRNEREGIAKPFTKIFLQNIRVYAVDQTFEKAADGSEARTVAKTVSLVVTPKQANKITFAENLGSIALIPRNPDDETIVDTSETTIEEIMGAAAANSREKEQMADDDDGGSQMMNGLRSIMEAALSKSIAASAPTPTVEEKPFQMTIIYPNEVEKIEFAATGEPIFKKDGDQAVPSAFVDESATPESEAEAEPFPIDLQVK